MKKEKSFIVGLDELDLVVAFLKDQFKFCRVFAFYGPLGAGKTTLVRRLLCGSGITDPITSPTFTYLNLYKNDAGQTFCHFDLYRIEKLKDFLAAGFDEYLHDGQNVVLVEWPEVIEPLLRENICRIKIDYDQDPDKREIRCVISYKSE